MDENGLGSDDLKDRERIARLLDEGEMEASGSEDRDPSARIDVADAGTLQLEIAYEPYDTDSVPDSEVERLADAFETWLEYEDIMPEDGWNRTYGGHTAASFLLDEIDYTAAGLYRFCDNHTFRGGKDGVFIQAAANTLDDDWLILPQLETPTIEAELQEAYEDLHPRVRHGQKPEDANLQPYESHDAFLDDLERYQELYDDVKTKIERQTDFAYPEIRPEEGSTVPAPFTGIGHRNDKTLLLEGGDLDRIGWHNQDRIIILQDDPEVPDSNTYGEMYAPVDDAEPADNTRFKVRRVHPEPSRRERAVTKLKGF
ncbi:MAG: hypothetical protein SVU32_07675 [Candidatus Nanohaloarchaea archaeon]|nr:hypothetical protein [Candidatus Nanohaloarchaea archaeon]